MTVDSDVSVKVGTPQLVRTLDQALERGLAPWRPGQSGNPGGRPKAEVSLTALMRAGLAERPEIVRRTLELAEKGDVNARATQWAVELVYAYAWGKPVQLVERTDEERLAAFQDQQQAFIAVIQAAMVAKALAQAETPMLTETPEPVQ